MNLAIEHEVRFVPKAGGHSPWPTIGKDGIMVHLSALIDVSVDRKAMTVTVQRGALQGDMLAKFAEAGVCHCSCPFPVV